MLHDDLARKPSLTAESLSGLPPGFNPRVHPVIAKHWFGIEVETSTDAIDNDALDLDREAA